MGETGLNSEKHVATSLGSKLEHIAFSVLYSMVSGNNDHSDLLNGVIMLFEDMQLISFAFSPEFYQHMPHWAMHVTNPLAYRPAEYSAFVILLGIVIGFLVLAVVCAVEVAMSFGSGKFAGASLLALKTLRLITSLLGTILFIPFLEILLAAVTCTGEQSHLREYPQVQCFSGAYSAQTIIVILSLLLFIPYNIAMSAIYLDTSPSRVNKASRTPIGRLDTIYAIARIFIVMIFTLTRTPALKIAFLIMVTFMLSVLIIRYQPFYISLYNELRAALFFAAASAAVVALISHLLKLDTIALPIATAASAPVGAIVGVFTCRRVYKTTINRVYRQIQVKHETLGKSPLGKSFQALGVPADPEINSTRDLSDDPELGDMFTGTSAIRDIHRITSTRTRPKTIHVFRHVGEVEIACRFVHNNRSPEALYIMEEIFGEGFEQFPKNALLKLVYAGYLEVFTDSTNQEPAYFVQLAKALKPAFDARFFIFMQDRILEQSKRTEGLNASTLNISSYVEFQTMQNGARRDHLATLIELRAFLSHIRNGQRGRDPKTYPIFLQRISEAEQRASEYYKKLIARWPKSKVLLRMYGSFLLQIKNERESASKYMLMAEEIEEIETRMSTAPVLQRHGSTRSSAKASQSLANLSSRTSLSRSNTLTKKVMSKPKTRLDTIMSPAESKVVDSDSDLSGLQGVPVVTLMQSPGAHISPEESVELDFDEEQPIQKSVSLVNTSQLRRRMSLSKYNEEEGDAGMGPQLSAETKGVGFNVAPSEDDPGFRENRMPSESNGGSTKSSEREAKLKLYNKLQLQTRLKEPVVRLDRDQKIMGSVYIVNIVVAFAIGLWSFSAAEGSIKGFARGTRLSRNMVYLTNAVRSFVRVADVSSDPQAQAASQAKFNDRHETFEGMMQNFSMYQLPYLAAFYADPRDIAVKISTYPLPVKTISHVNAYEVTKMTYQHGQAILSHGWEYFRTPRLQDNTVRFFLDNVLEVAEAYERAILRGQQAWTSASMTNVYILYGLLALVLLCMMAWGYLVFWPMIHHSHQEQVRSLRCFAYLPKKILLHMLTELEEQIESITDEMTAASQSSNENGTEQNENQNQSAATAANRLLNRTVDPDAMIKKSPFKKHVWRYMAGISLLTLPAISLLIAPIMRALISVKYAVTMNYTNGRRLHAESTVFLGREITRFDNTTWLPHDPVMWFTNSLSLLEKLHQDSITGVNCMATASIPALQHFTLVDAPCQPACGNLTAGLDAQIEMFMTAAHDFHGHVLKDDVAGGMPQLDFMTSMLSSIIDNLNQLDDQFQLIILEGNQVGQTAMIVLFCGALIALALSFFFFFRYTTRARMVEMDCAVTLVFALPETAIQTVPEIKRFIESGGMFAEDGVRKKK